MPIYEYICESCGERSEHIQKMSDEPLTQCGTCGNATLKKLVSAAGFRLKGGGWYETDFKGKNQKYGTQKKTADKSDSGKTA